MLTLSALPSEVLLLIFHSLASVSDAIRLAQTSSQYHRLLEKGGTKTKVFQSVICHQIQAADDFEKDVRVLDRFISSRALAGPLVPYIKGDVPVAAFLRQFDDLECFWIGDEFILKSASYQQRLLSMIHRKPAVIAEDTTVIARTLHCFILVAKVVLVTTQECEGRDDPESFIAELLRPGNSDSGIAKPNSIASIFRSILETVRSILLRQQPEDWPMVLTVLCLLFWISVQLTPHDPDPIEPLSDVSNAIDGALRQLCRLYYVSSSGHHPFTNLWDPATYENLVGGNTHAIEQFKRLHNIWRHQTADDPDVIGLDDEASLEGDDDWSGDADLEEREDFQGMQGFITRMETVCYTLGHVDMSYPPAASELALCELQGLDNQSLSLIAY